MQGPARYSVISKTGRVICKGKGPNMKNLERRKQLLTVASMVDTEALGGPGSGGPREGAGRPPGSGGGEGDKGAADRYVVSKTQHGGQTIAIRQVPNKNLYYPHVEGGKMQTSGYYKTPEEAETAGKNWVNVVYKDKGGAGKDEESKGSKGGLSTKAFKNATSELKLPVDNKRIQLENKGELKTAWGWNGRGAAGRKQTESIEQAAKQSGWEHVSAKEGRDVDASIELMMGSGRGTVSTVGAKEHAFEKAGFRMTTYHFPKNNSYSVIVEEKP